MCNLSKDQLMRHIEKDSVALTYHFVLVAVYQSETADMNCSTETRHTVSFFSLRIIRFILRTKTEGQRKLSQRTPRDFTT